MHTLPPHAAPRSCRRLQLAYVHVPCSDSEWSPLPHLEDPNTGFKAFGARAVALSPCLVPYEHPAAFAQAFERTHPQLHAVLVRAPRGRVGWAEVCAWMWPLWDV